jgi:hypothetical protein
MSEAPADLQRIYHRRFSQTAAYRQRVWEVLTAVRFDRRDYTKTR